MEFEAVIRIKVDPKSSYLGVDNEDELAITDMLRDILFELDDTRVLSIEVEEI